MSVGGGSDTLHGEAGADSFWFDSSDTAADADAAEVAATAVHEIASFTAPVDGTQVSMEIAGQDMVDPDSTVAYTDAYESYPLFSNGPQYDDIVQGQLGDCYFLSGLAALAQTDAGLITQSITALGDGTYAVRYYRYGTAQYYRIDGQLPTGGPGFARLTGNGSELWVALLEKAFAQFRYGQNSYVSLEGGSLSEPFTAITGQSIVGRATSTSTAAEIAQQLQSDLTAGHAVTAMSFTAVAPIVANHGYSVHSVENVDGVWYITVYNPWGYDGASWDTDSADGLLRLTADLFRNAFYGLTTCLA